MRLEDNKKPEWYCESSELPLDDQEWIWKNVPLPEEYAVADEIKLRELETNVNVSVNESDNDIGKRKVNFELTPRKQELIKKLKIFNYRTPPILIAPALEEFFIEWSSKSTHWPFMARTYTPKTIKSVLNRIINLYNSGYLIDNPPGLFTLIIKKRHKRKNKSSYQ